MPPKNVKKKSSGYVKKYPGQNWVGLLFTAGQKYVWVMQGPISNPGHQPLTPAKGL